MRSHSEKDKMYQLALGATEQNEWVYLSPFGFGLVKLNKDENPYSKNYLLIEYGDGPKITNKKEICLHEVLAYTMKKARPYLNGEGVELEYNDGVEVVQVK